MKIIDFEKKGNQVKFYLGDDDCNDYWGDDWNDYPYDCNAGPVYDRYIKGRRVITFDFDDVVVEPCDGYNNCEYSKQDMMDRTVPCIVVLKKEDNDDDNWDTSFGKIVANPKAIKYYFGDKLEEKEFEDVDEAKKSVINKLNDIEKEIEDIKKSL